MKYDLHTHTESSRCSNMSVDLLISTARKRGLDGVAITDHNTIENALIAKKQNKDKNFEIIIGEEVSTDLGDVLVYNVKKKIEPGNFFDVIKEAKRQNALVCIAHPSRFFPLKGFRKELHEVEHLIDAVETKNGRTPFFSNTKAAKNAAKLKVAKVAGSDAHFSFEVGRCFTKFEGSFKDAIKNKSTKPFGTSFFGPLGHMMTVKQKYLRRK